MAKLEADDKARPSQLLLLALLRRTSRVSMFAAGALLAVLFVHDLPERFIDVLFKVCLLVLFLQAGAWATALINHSLQSILRFFNVDDAAGTSALGVLRFFAITIVWVAVFLVVLDNMGIQIGPLLTGLGIGGIAIAFALQAILGDVFCSVAIILDKPFEVGDFIYLDKDNQGTVERIGIKTTRVRSLSGEEIVFSNADLLSSRIHNYKGTKTRRSCFRLGIEYRTPLDTLKIVPGVLTEMMQRIDKVRVDRVNLVNFAESAYEYEVVLWVMSGEYKDYVEAMHKVNLGIIAEFQKLGVDFAFPTRTVHVEVPEGVPITPGIIKHAVTID